MQGLRPKQKKEPGKSQALGAAYTYKASQDLGSCFRVVPLMGTNCTESSEKHTIRSILAVSFISPEPTITGNWDHSELLGD